MAKRRKHIKSRQLIAIAILLLVGILLYRHFQKESESITIDNLPPIAEGFESYGIDVSHHQGKIDWPTVVSASDSLIKFVYCKATEGVKHVDKKWNTNRSFLVEANIPNGAYHFYLPNKNAIKQAEHFLNIYNPVSQDLPPVLDVEMEDKSDVKLIEGMREWLSLVEDKCGLRPVIYTSHHFYNTKFKERFPGYKFWIADYNEDVKGLDDNDIIHWQFTEHGKIPGIKGHVDLNYSKLNY